MQCETVEELIVLAKENGAELTEEQAQAYLDEFEDFDLDNETFKRALSASCYFDCDCYGDVSCREYDCPTYDCGYDCPTYTQL